MSTKETALRFQVCREIQKAIRCLDSVGWSYEAQLLADDYDRAIRLPDLLMVRDDAERLVEQMLTNTTAEEAGQ